MAYLMIHNKGNDTVDNKTKELLKEGINLMREIKNKVCKGVDNCEICPFFNVDSAGWCHCEFNIMQSMNNYRNGLTKIEPLTKEKIKEVQDFHLEAQGLTKEEYEKQIQNGTFWRC